MIELLLETASPSDEIWNNRYNIDYFKLSTLARVVSPEISLSLGGICFSHAAAWLQRQLARQKHCPFILKFRKIRI